MSRWQRLGRALSVANVWACGVASAQHDWTGAAIASFFALACWRSSDLKVWSS